MSSIDATTGQDLSQSRQGELRATTISLVVLAAAFVALRFFARWKAGVHWGIDDYLTVVSLLILLLLLLTILFMINWGLGIHAAALQYADVVLVLKGLLAFECVYVTTVVMIKIALLYMYRRAFDIRSLRIQGYILGGIVISWGISIIMVCIFQCRPIAKAWDPMLEGTCINLKGSFIGNAVPNILTDIAILALPIRYVWKMVPDRTMRLQLSVVFLLGSFVVFTSIYRFITLFEFIPTDTTWTLATACAWCIVECAVGIISVCLPTLGPLLTCLTCIPVPRGPSAQKNRSHPSGSNVSSGLEPKLDKFSEFTDNAYGSVLRNSGPPLSNSDSPKNFERLGSRDETITEIHELGQVKGSDRTRIEGGHNQNNHWDGEPHATGPAGLKPRELSGGFKALATHPPFEK